MKTEEQLAALLNILLTTVDKLNYLGFEIDYNDSQNERWATIEIGERSCWGQIEIEYKYDLEVKRFRNEPESYSKLEVEITSILFIGADEEEYNVTGKAWDVVEDDIKDLFNASEVYFIH